MRDADDAYLSLCLHFVFPYCGFQITLPPASLYITLFQFHHILPKSVCIPFFVLFSLTILQKFMVNVWLKIKKVWRWEKVCPVCSIYQLLKIFRGHNWKWCQCAHFWWLLIFLCVSMCAFSVPYINENYVDSNCLVLAFMPCGVFIPHTELVVGHAGSVSFKIRFAW